MLEDKKDDRETRQEQYERFVANMERDTYKLKPKVYKIIKRILEDEVHRANIAPPDCEKMIKYYVNLWSDSDNEIEVANHEENKYEPFSWEELDGALKSSRNGNAPGSDKLPTDLFKNASITIKKRLLAFYNKILSGATIPEDFRTAIVISIFEKGD